VYRFNIAIAIIFVVFVLITSLLNYLFKTRRFVKYLPSIISLIVAVINYVLARTSHSDGFKDLGYLIMSIFLFIGSVSGFLSAVYFDFRKKNGK
jgi:hypothetical protein